MSKYIAFVTLTMRGRWERKYTSRSPPSISSMIMKLGSLSRHTPSSWRILSCLKLLINWASFKNSSFSCWDAPLRSVCNSMKGRIVTQFRNHICYNTSTVNNQPWLEMNKQALNLFIRKVAFMWLNSKCTTIIKPPYL